MLLLNFIYVPVIMVIIGDYRLKDMKPHKNGWFRKAVLASNLPIMLSTYNVETILNKSRSFTCYSPIEYDILFCSFAICGTGNNDEITDEQFKSIMKECLKILESKPNYLFPLNRFGIEQGIRPYWFSIPIYIELLKPFNNEINSIFGVKIEEIFYFISNVASKSYNTKEAYFDIYIYPGLISLKEDLTIEPSAINSLEDTWNKLFIELENNVLIPLRSRFPETIYAYVCEKLESSFSTFGTEKGQSLESLVERELKQFMPRSDFYWKYYIGNKKHEKDLLILYKKIGFCIECKSVKMNKASFDWNIAKLSSNIEKNVSKALRQINRPLNLLLEGGIIKHKETKYKIKSKDYYHGFIVTDQIYSPLIRASFDHVSRSKSHSTNELWHGKDIWVGSIIDFIFLLKVTKTPSILFDYLSNFRSFEHFKHNDEPESWMLYRGNLFNPSTFNIEREYKFNVIVKDEFEWDKFRNNEEEYCKPIWLNGKFDLIYKYDKAGLFSNSSNVINQLRSNVSKHPK
ncbi:hypothetical protein SAMN04488589_1727 [Methanolobus vulcani]|uniref:Uncharacterized protein n=1 Tax=Methanolobus vulcani TaxID=38026 RepID=A0A7Z7AXQ1_9EURY|nr:hypothetical protein SAMN04488589_1727 [Methanolobus vulcani]